MNDLKTTFTKASCYYSVVEVNTGKWNIKGVVETTRRFFLQAAVLFRWLKRTQKGKKERCTVQRPANDFYYNQSFCFSAWSENRKMEYQRCYWKYTRVFSTTGSFVSLIKVKKEKKRNKQFNDLKTTFTITCRSVLVVEV